MSVYRGAVYQRGHGIGSFLGGLFRSMTPLFKNAASAVGKEALHQGIGFLGDIAPGTMHPKEAAGARFKNFTSALKRKFDDKMDRVFSGGGAGSRGYKRRRITRVTPQSLTNRLGTRVSKKRRRRRKKIRKPKRKKTALRRKKHSKVVKRRSRKGRKVFQRKGVKGRRRRDIFN